MTRKKTTRRLKAGTPGKVDYEVGYGKPPKATQFQPGSSGNPQGRPRGSKNRATGRTEERLKEIVLEEAYREIPIRDGDKTVKMSVAQAAIRSLGVNAAKGRVRAQEVFAELIATTEASERRLHEELLQAAIEYKTYWETQIERSKREGLPPPEPLPHPDDIVIDLQTGNVYFTGPRTPEEKEDWDRMTAFVRKTRQRLADCETALAEATDPDERAAIGEDIAHLREALDRLCG